MPEQIIVFSDGIILSNGDYDYDFHFTNLGFYRFAIFFFDTDDTDFTDEIPKVELILIDFLPIESSKQKIN